MCPDLQCAPPYSPPLVSLSVLVQRPLTGHLNSSQFPTGCTDYNLVTTHFLSGPTEVDHFGLNTLCQALCVLRILYVIPRDPFSFSFLLLFFFLAAPVACRSSQVSNWTCTRAAVQAAAVTMPDTLILNPLGQQGNSPSYLILKSCILV